MKIVRTLLLKASESRWLAAHLPDYWFARRAVRRFMPGETIEAALAECAVLGDAGMGSIITRLGENITQRAEAEAVAEHYLGVLAEIRARGLDTHVSVKLTQLGLDIDADMVVTALQQLMRKAAPDPVWIDMESSRYTDATIAVFERARATGENVGLCVQAYLLRTQDDLRALLPSTTAIRLVKGAYQEPPAVAFERKAAVDENYVACARLLLAQASTAVVGYMPAFATHDVRIIERIRSVAEEMGVPRDRYEFELLYGINTQEQKKIAREGLRIRVLISYGSAWFAWYMRRLAERPANVWFLLRSVLR